MQIKEIVRVERVTKIKCDKCGIIAKVGAETEEFLSYSDSAGYNAKKYDDGDGLDLDLCEACKFELLKDYIQVSGSFLR